MELRSTHPCTHKFERYLKVLGDNICFLPRDGRGVNRYFRVHLDGQLSLTPRLADMKRKLYSTSTLDHMALGASTKDHPDPNPARIRELLEQAYVHLC